LKILVADDDAVSRRLMARVLEQSGYEVMTAENGREAVEALMGEHRPRLALIDWMMPELDGPGVCREIRSRHHQSYVYITLLTSKESKEDIVAGLEAGADDYLTKPCNAEELKARLRTGQRILDLEDKLVEAREQMWFKATHDALTSLWDRGAVMGILDRELSRARREACTVSLLLCDLDHFKQINDVHGHLAGDRVLQEAASRLSSLIRPYDAAGRYGGEEFLILLTGCGADETKMRAEELRKSICSRPFEITDGEVSLTISIGTVSSVGWSSTVTADQLLHAADQALYRAKAQGRNCVCVSEPPVVSAERERDRTTAG
jgi:two-component system, cell cycle response regulator